MSGKTYGYVRVSTQTQKEGRRVAIVVLGMPLLDTRENRDLTGVLVADIVLQLLSYAAQTEREFIRQRQAEGIAAAKEKGVRFGRTPIPMPEQFEPLAIDWRHGRITASQAGRELGISRTTFKRRAEEWLQAEALREKAAQTGAGGSQPA